MISRNLITFIVPLAIIATAIPLMLEKVPRNSFYGFRTAFTMSSEENWYRANRISGFALLAAGVFWLAIGQLLPRVTQTAQSEQRLLGWLGGGSVMAACAVSYWLTYRA